MSAANVEKELIKEMINMPKILVVVDMQNDFVSGALGTPEAKAIVPNVVKLVEEYSKIGVLTWFTRDTHQKNYLETREGKNLPIEHCIQNTWGWEIIDELEKTNKVHWVINKPTFGSTDLMNEMIWDIDSFGGYVDEMEIEFCGLCTDICVISNALLAKAYFPEAKIIIHADCCAGVTPESHQRALEAMKMCHIDIIGE